MMGRNFIILIIALFVSYSSLAQQSNFVRVFDYTSKTPKGLLTDRSVVFVNIDEENESRANWKKIAAKAQPAFADMGIDVIGYFNVQDVFAGLETQRAFAKFLLDRNINNILMIKKFAGQYTLKMAHFNKKQNFLDQGQKAWKTQGSGLDDILANLRRAVGARGMTQENFLITKNPEYFEDINLFKRGRYEEYNRDLKLDKLAIPMFSQIAIPSNTSESTSQISNRNATLRRDSLDLVSIMKTYPFQYGFVDPSKTEKALRNEKYEFVLYYLNTSENVIHKLLNYPKEKHSKSHAPTVKFYVKHIFSGEIYLGKWDASTSWQQALRNHLEGIKARVEKK